VSSSLRNTLTSVTAASRCSGSPAADNAFNHRNRQKIRLPPPSPIPCFLNHKGELFAFKNNRFLEASA